MTFFLLECSFTLIALFTLLRNRVWTRLCSRDSLDLAVISGSLSSSPQAHSGLAVLIEIHKFLCYWSGCLVVLVWMFLYHWSGCLVVLVWMFLYHWSGCSCRTDLCPCWGLFYSLTCSLNCIPPILHLCMLKIMKRSPNDRVAHCSHASSYESEIPTSSATTNVMFPRTSMVMSKIVIIF